MTVENANYIADLNTLQPSGGDFISEGDDHIRLLKQVLRNSFSGFPGAVIVYGEDAVNTDNYVINPTPAIPSYKQGMMVVLLVQNANAGAATLNVSGLGAVPIKSGFGSDISAGALPSGIPVLLSYNSGAFYMLAGGDFESGTKTVFAQASAPLGWTQDTTYDDVTLRVVSGTGGGAGGLHPISAPPSAAHTHATAGTVLTTAQLPAHTHSFSGNTSTNGAHSHTYDGAVSTSVGGGVSPAASVLQTTTQSAGDHSHSFSGTTSSVGSGAAHDHGNVATDGPETFTPKYVDAVLAVRS